MQRTLAQIPVPHGGSQAAHEQKKIATLIDKISQLRTLVQHLIINGILGDADTCALVESIMAVADADGDLSRLDRRREALMKVLDAADLNEVQRQAVSDLDDLYFPVGTSWGNAGYLLGLAVGLRLPLEALSK